jgi:methylsterol monooxygenase
MHHEFIAPTAMSAQYASILEQVFINVLPIAIGPMLMRSHVTTYWAWITLGMYSSVRSHCGFGTPFSKAPLEHDFHHRYFMN